MNKLSFLDGDDAADTDVVSLPEAEAPEPAAQAVPEPDAGQPRAADGKFAPKAAPEPAPADAPVATAVPAAPAPAAVVAPEPGHVPLSALLDEREKRQASDRRLQEFEAREAKAKADRDAAPALPVPDFTENPTGHLDAREADLQARIYAINREFSRKLAVKEYGKETIDTVQQWATAKCDAEPQFNSQVYTSEDPYEFAVQAWKREQVLAKFSADDLAQYDEFAAWKAAKAAGQDPPLIDGAAPVAASPPTLAPKAPPQSLAAAPSAGGPAHVPQGPGQAFAGVFK